MKLKNNFGEKDDFLDRSFLIKRPYRLKSRLFLQNYDLETDVVF